MNFELLKNSLLLAGGVAACATVAGFLAAVWAAAVGRTAQRLLLGCAVLALCFPAFMQVNCWLDLLGASGRWRAWLPLDIYSRPGAVWILTLTLWAIPFGFNLAALQRMDCSWFELEPRLKGIQLVRYLLLPLTRSALWQSAVLVFVLSLNNFTVPALLQVRVLPAQIWVRFETNLDAMAAFLLALPVILAPALLLIFSRRQNAFTLSAGRFPYAVLKQALGSSCMTALGIASLCWIGCSVALPSWQLLGSWRTWQPLPGTWAAASPVVLNTFLLAAGASSLTAIFGVLASRCRCGRLLWLLFFVPGVLIGILFVTIFNRGFFDPVYHSVFIIMIAWFVRYCAIGWQSASTAVAAISRDQVEAGLLAGASRWQLLRHVQLPQMMPRLAVAWYLVYLLCLWDIETILLILPPGGETLAVRIFGLLHYGHNNQVNALCLLALVLAAAPLLAGAIWRRSSSALLSVCVVAAILCGCSPSSRLPESRFFQSVEIIGRRGAGAGEFNKPRSLALDREDNLYVVDMTGRVQKFSKDGKFLLSWQMPQTDLGKPKGMCLDEKGNIVVVEPHYQRVNHFSPEGKLVAQWGKSGTNRGELTLPRSVAVDSRGDVFVTEYTRVDRVQGFAGSDKKPFLLFGDPGSGPGQFNRAEGIGLDKEGRLYVADSCNHRIEVFSPDGKWLRSYGQPGNNRGEMSYPYDVRVDPAGNQFVCEFGNSRIQVFDAHDQPIEIIGGPGAAPGQFSNPWSIALNSRGDLYVCDAGNHRVQKFVRK